MLLILLLGSGLSLLTIRNNPIKFTGDEEHNQREKDFKF